MGRESGDRDPRELPPGLDRRMALLDSGAQITLSDFTVQERAELARELAELRASLRAKAKA